ncbi:aldose 1-epimerase family protein [Actinokineospora bangkokensis]|uniref:Aldose epimerase n=1 Tax=Actinokineospora bangkokensis TaxID=1193682 RepID=A0A1Q9LCX8_9PSEU|nr:aldose 1-epimerase family protein [Actinokineospora bangkokensis]OLR89890.1 aldose epimerase [Actinokineospora bangkokensis]
MDVEQWEIRSGRARAVVSAHGAGLRVLERDGVPYAETYAADQAPPMGAGAVLVPWPNRVADGQWPLDGVTQHLNLTEPDRGNAIHGLVRHEEWTATARAQDSVTLSVLVDRRPGWPFTFETTVTYFVDDSGLTVTHGLRNLSEDPMPFGVGTHPYPRPGNADVDDCALTLAATTRLPVDPERLLPSGPAEPITDFDFAAGQPLRGVVLDDAFGGCEPGADGLVRHAVTGPGGGVEVWADAVFKWVQVYTAAEFPGKGQRAVAVEPMTCPPDALNSGEDVLVLAPGDSWTGSWGISWVEGEGA